MKIKPGANYEGLSVNMKWACQKIDAVYTEYNYVCVLTSGKDGQHGNGSLHYEGEAADFRTRHVMPELQPQIANACQIALGDEFEVILESDHLHVEYDPQHNRRISA